MTTDPAVRIERALHEIAEEIVLDDGDLAAARNSIATRADALGPTRRPAIVAAAASVVLLTGVGGLWLATGRDGDHPSTNPSAAASAPEVEHTPTVSAPSTDSDSSTIDAATSVATPLASDQLGDPTPVRGDQPPGVAAETPILDPDVYIGSTRLPPWAMWVNSVHHWQTFVQFDGDEPSGVIAVDASDSEQWMEFSGAPSIDVAAGVAARVLGAADTDSGRIGILIDTTLIRVSWHGSATRDDAATVAGSVAAGGAAITAPPGFVDRSPRFTARSTSGSNILVDHYASTNADVDLTVMKMIIDSYGLAHSDGAVMASRGAVTPPWALGGDVALRQLDDDSIIVVHAPPGSGVDVEEAIDGVRLVDTASVPAPGVVPADAEVYFGESNFGRWFVATWTDAFDHHCSIFRPAHSYASERCGDDSSSRCWIADTYLDDPATIVLIDGDPETVEWQLDEGEMITAELESTAGFVMATGPALGTSHDVWIDAEPTVCQ